MLSCSSRLKCPPPPSPPSPPPAHTHILPTLPTPCHGFTTVIYIMLTILPGVGASGKSTFSRQLRILYGDGFTEDERRDFRCLVRGNIRQAVAKISRGIKDAGLELTDLALQVSLHRPVRTHLQRFAACLRSPTLSSAATFRRPW